MDIIRYRKLNLLEIIGMLIFISISIILALYIKYICYLDDKILSIFSILIVFSSFVYIYIVSIRYIWTIYNIYMIVFVIFHFGIIIINAFGLEVSPNFKRYINKWFFSYYGNYAIVLVTIGLSSVMSGVLFMLALGKGRTTEATIEMPNPKSDKVLTIFGFLLVAVPAFSWFFVTLSHGGLSLLTGSYESFLENTAGYLSGWYYYFPLGWGLIVLTVAESSPLRMAGFSIFLLFSVVALPLGLRGEVLFPLFSALAVAGMKGLHLNLKKTMILGFCLLCTISALRQIRNVGIEKVRIAEIAVSPVDSLGELGSSIRPVVEVVSWADAGEEYIHGQSYWAPIDRALVYIVPGWTRPLLPADDRLLNVLVQRRVGPIGFSPVAEAYRNFGKFGVVFVMFFTGMFLTWLDSLRPTKTNQLIAGFVFFPLLIQVRNAFVFVPSNILIGLFLLFIMKQFYSEEKTGEKIINTYNK